MGWFEAVTHCESRGARLPTEAEWEYTARGPDGLVYPWGNDFEADNTVYAGNSGDLPAPVGSRPGGVSWVGAFDMSGNVWEWVSSIYTDYPYNAADGREKSLGNESSSVRALRGGGWYNSTDDLRAANRYGLDIFGFTVNFGVFRCARSYEDETFTAQESAQSAATTATAIPLGYPGNPVTANDDWTPLMQDFGGVQMALVPAGCFMMGSEDGNSDEEPVHEQCFEQPFWIDVTEVTNAQYASRGSAGTYSGGNQPREHVSWFESEAYCRSRQARLPTEAEWEYAARGPDNLGGLVYPWGNGFVRGNIVDVGQGTFGGPAEVGADSVVCPGWGHTI